jgi:hypothetical protein
MKQENRMIGVIVQFPKSLAGNVGDMSATCRRQGEMSPIFVPTGQFWRHVPMWRLANPKKRGPTRATNNTENLPSPPPPPCRIRRRAPTAATAAVMLPPDPQLPPPPPPPCCLRCRATTIAVPPQPPSPSPCRRRAVLLPPPPLPPCS